MKRFIAIVLAAFMISFSPAVMAEDSPSPCVIADDASVSATPGPLDGQEDMAEMMDDPLAGRLGSTGEGWQQLYHTDNEDFFAMSWEGCGPLTAYQVFEEGSWPVVNINLYADRAADIEAGTLGNPSDANWTQEEALFIAYRLLPEDVKIAEPTTTEVGNMKYLGHSDQLSEAVPQEALDHVSATGTPGDVQVILYLSTDGTVYAIDIQVGGYGEK